MSSYLSRQQAEDRLLSRYGMDVSLTEGVLSLASEQLDAYYAPFTGSRLDEEQERAFPRSWLRPGDEAGIVPEPILDAVCLLAGAEAEGEDDTPVTAERVMQVSRTYAVGKVPKSIKRVALLVAPYQRPVDDEGDAGTAYVSRSWF